MVLIEPVGGLCNRMRAIASLNGLMKQLKIDRTFTVIWKKNSDLNCLFNALFSDDPSFAIATSSFTFRNHTIVPYKYLFYYISELYKSPSFVNIQNVREIDFIDRKHDKYIYIYTCHAFYANQDYSCFHPTRELVTLANDIQCKIQKNKTIGLHIRRQDNLNSIKYSPNELFHERIQTIMHTDPETKFFLATDDSEVRVEFMNRYKNRLIVQSQSDFSRKTISGMKYALVDLLCLASCKEILGSYYSSFSEVAGHYGNKRVTILSSDINSSI
ncbi:hypothetical protein FACS1894184_15730 [Clostridia bacterium]|nr:hypothetical protein FACS1894184_15730 [Clostridia bacterium]